MPTVYTDTEPTVKGTDSFQVEPHLGAGQNPAGKWDSEFDMGAGDVKTKYEDTVEDDMK